VRWEYSPAKPLAKSIFATKNAELDGTTHEVSKEEMKQKALDLRNRLHDAPAVMAYAERVVSQFSKELKLLYTSFYLEDLQELDPKFEFRSAESLDVSKELFDLRMEAFRKNIAAYERLLPVLLKEHGGEFVALCDGKVVGFHKDELALMDRISKSKEFPPEQVLVHRVKQGHRTPKLGPNLRLSSAR